MRFFQSYNLAIRPIVDQHSIEVVGRAKGSYVPEVRDRETVLIGQFEINSASNEVFAGNLLAGKLSDPYVPVRSRLNPLGLKRPEGKVFLDRGVYAAGYRERTSAGACVRHRTENSTPRFIRGYRHYSGRAQRLADTLIVAKDKHFILADGSPGRRPKLISPKRRNFGTVKKVTRIQRAIA